MTGGQALAIARNIGAPNYIITEQQDRRRDGSPATVYVLYRKGPAGNVRVGKRRSPRAVLTLLQTITGK
jgi:hypothetical protein